MEGCAMEWKRVIFIFVLIEFIFLVHPAGAQDIYLFVAGKKAVREQTGDELHLYEMKIKAPSARAVGVFEIFDAAIGSNADVIGFTKTSTTFQLYKGTQTVPATLLQTLTVSSEQRYLNRWISFDTLSSSSETDEWIFQWTGGAGDGVNAFKIRIVPLDDSNADEWIFTLKHLPLCLVGLVPEEEVQFRTIGSKPEHSKELVVKGAEGATVVVRDKYGKSSGLPLRKDFLDDFFPDNEWGICISGSQMRVNNLVVTTKTELPFIWQWNPIIIKKPTPPRVTVIQQEESDCLQKKLWVEGGKLRSSLAPQWFIDNHWYESDTITVSFNDYGTYSGKVLLPTQGIYFPRFWLHSFVIQVQEPPVVKISVPKEIISPGEAIIISASQPPLSEKKLYKYQWYVNGEYRGNQRSLRFFSSIPGIYNIQLIVSDEAQRTPCNQGSATATIRVNSQPYAEIVGPKVIARSVITTFRLITITDPDDDELSIIWEGAGIIGSNKDKEVRVKQDRPGLYSLKVTVSDGTRTNNASYSVVTQYRVNAEPTAVFSLPQKVAPGDEILLDAKNSIDPDNQHLKYHWSVSDGSELSSSKALLSFDEPGTYSVALTVDDGEGVENSINSVTHSIHINAPPVPCISAPSHTNSSLVFFSAEDSYDSNDDTLSFTWDFGDGTRATSERVQHLYQQSGTYTITLTVNDGQKLSNSIQQKQHILRINKNPIAAFSIPKQWEPDLPLELDATGSIDPDGEIVEYKWFVNGNVISNERKTTFLFSSPGDYAIALQVKDNSGFDDATGIQSTLIHVNYPPIVKWKYAPVVAEPGETVVFDASESIDQDGTIAKAEWEFSDGIILKGLQAKRIFKVPGKYTVRVTVDDGSGFRNAQQSENFTILVNNPPLIITQKNIRSNELRIHLDASQSYDIDGHPLSFEWMLPDNTKRTEASFWWQAASGGTHIITLTVNDGQGKKNSIVREVVRVQINRPPVAVVDSVIFTCVGQVVLFNSTRCYDPDFDILTTQWDFGDGATSDETNPTHTYYKEGFYTVRLALSDGFVEQPTIATIPVFVEASPRAIMTFRDTIICTNVPLEFDGSLSTDPGGGISSYSWDFGDGTSAFGPKVSHSYTLPGTYKAILTVVGSGSGRCSRISQVAATINVVEGPKPVISVPNYISVGETLNLDATLLVKEQRVHTSLWKVESNDTTVYSQNSVFSFIPQQPGIYHIELTVYAETQSTCTSATARREVHVNAPPVIQVNVPSAVALGDVVVLDASGCYDPDGIITKYEWYIDGVFYSFSEVVPVQFTSTKFHTVQLRITDHSGTSTRTVEETATIFVNSKPLARIMVPENLYEGEETVLKASSIVDDDGDSLEFKWKVNGKEIEQPKVLWEKPGTYILTLIANDQRGLSNSIDSVVQIVSVQSAPVVESSRFPKYWIKGSTIQMQQLTQHPHSGFVNNKSLQSSIQLVSTGEQNITLGWAPKGTVLRTWNYPVYVLEPLQFTEQPQQIDTQWNPSNPEITLVSPKVNRPEHHQLQWEWFKGEKVIAHGAIVKMLLTKGVNTFRVKVSERNVMNSKPVEIEIKILCN